MASKNKLLGFSEEKVEKKMVAPVNVNTELGWPKRLYHKDCLTGKVYQTFPEQYEAKKSGWVESPAELKTE